MDYIWDETGNDECHGLTKDQAQLFLKHVEDVPTKNYFIFCTTEPNKVLETLRDRCTLIIPFEKVPDGEIKKLLIRICECENLQADDQVLDRIIGEAAGKPRLAVQDLEQSFYAGDLKGKENF